jgi:hypothetical protein
LSPPTYGAAVTFSHPLARSAKVFAANSHDGAEQRILVIVTTVQLDPHDKRYKNRLVERLSGLRARLRGQVGSRDRIHADEPTKGLARTCEGATL